MFPPNPFSGSLDEEIDAILLDMEDEDVVRCECGSESVWGKGYKFHSFWCPKYIDNG